TASFSAAGSYVLRLTASDTALTATDDVMIVVNPVVTSGTSLRIEAGGTASYTDIKGNVWMPDTYYTDGTGGGMVNRGPIAIANTTDPTIFQTEHYCVNSYSIPIANGTYTVNLDFAETYQGITAVGQRVFDVNVGGQSLTSLD